MYSASLPQKIHAQDLVNKEIPFYYNGSSAFAKRYTKQTGRAMLVPPNPVEMCHWVRDKPANSAGFMMFVDTNICRSGIHSHCFTCRKPPKGYTGCRMCKPSGSTKSTSPVQLIAAESVPESEYKRKMDDENTVHIFEDTFLSTKTIDSKPDKIERDKRLIVWEIKRPELDSFL